MCARKASVTKAVIPAAGWGTRILPATKAVPKELLAVVDKPMIQWVVEEAAGAGVTDVVIVISREKAALREHFASAPELEKALAAKGKDDLLAATKAPQELARVTFVTQDEPLGLGHAVLCARDAVGAEAFAVLLPDELFGGPELLNALIAAHEKFGASVIAVMEMPSEEIGNYGVVDPDPVSDDLVRMKDFIEKPSPDVAPSNLGSIGRYVLTPDVFDSLERTEPGAGGEIQLTDAIAAVARSGEGYAHIHRGPRHDAGRPLGYLKALVELGALHPELGEEFSEFLTEFVRRKGR
ncbi:MAG: UTP--glucose-1-phosphate uridylyltransferase [Actinomycetota bacterium]